MNLLLLGFYRMSQKTGTSFPDLGAAIAFSTFAGMLILAAGTVVKVMRIRNDNSLSLVSSDIETAIFLILVALSYIWAYMRISNMAGSWNSMQDDEKIRRAGIVTRVYCIISMLALMFSFFLAAVN